MSPKTKLIALSIILIALALSFGFFLRSFNQTPNINSSIPLGIAAVLFMAVFILQSLVIDKFYFTAGLCLAEALAIALPFYKEFSLILFSATAVLFIIFVKSSRQGNNEFRQFLKINISAAGSRALYLTSAGLLLFAVISYFQVVNFQDVVKLATKSTEVAVQQISAKLFPQISASLLVGQVQTLIKDLLVDLPKNIQNMVIVGLGALTFFSVRWVFSVLDWLAVVLASAIYKILAKTGFVVVKTEETEREMVTL